MDLAGYLKTSRSRVLTLRLQLANDGRGSGEGHRGDAPDSLLRRLTHAPDVRVVVLGGGVHAGHQAVGGAHQRKAGHPLHHILLGNQENSFRFT